MLGSARSSGRRPGVAQLAYFIDGTLGMSLPVVKSFLLSIELMELEPSARSES